VSPALSIASAALAALVTVSRAGSPEAADPAAGMIGQPAPPFRLADVRSGEPVSLHDLRGRIVVLHFGASW